MIPAAGLRASEDGWVPPWYLTTGEVARTFRVNVATVGRWRRKGLLRSIRTPSGLHRYDAAEIAKFLAGDGQ